jgi:hypothetical protein
MKAFLLRFEEKTVQARLIEDECFSPLAGRPADSGKMTSTTVAAAKTLTEVRSEGADYNPAIRGLCAFPR